MAIIRITRNAFIRLRFSLLASEKERRFPDRDGCSTAILSTVGAGQNLRANVY